MKSLETFSQAHRLVQISEEAKSVILIRSKIMLVFSNTELAKIKYNNTKNKIYTRYVIKDSYHYHLTPRKMHKK